MLKYTLTHSSQVKVASYDVRPDTRQAGFCGPGIHKKQLKERRDPKISQAPRPSKLKGQVNEGRPRQNNVTRNSRTNKTCPQYRYGCNRRNRTPRHLHPPTHQGVHTTPPSTKKNLQTWKDETESNVIIQGHPTATIPKWGQNQGIMDKTPK